MAVSYLRNTPMTGKSYTTPVDATERENARLKRIVADQLLDIDMLKELNRGNW